MFSHMRIARPVTDLARACTMYSQGLELQRIADFIVTSFHVAKMNDSKGLK